MKEADKWFEFSLDDLDSAAICSKRVNTPRCTFLPIRQQKRPLRAFCLPRDFIPPKIHNLIDLVNLCVRYDSSFAEFLSQARLLNQFYLPARYPGVLPGNPLLEVDKRTAEEALGWAKGIFLFIARKWAWPDSEPRAFKAEENCGITTGVV